MTFFKDHITIILQLVWLVAHFGDARIFVCNDLIMFDNYILLYLGLHQSVVLVDIIRDVSRVGVQVKVGDVELTLYPNRHLVHPNFVVLHRHDNGSIISVPEPITCDYRTPPTAQPHVAADICDGMVSKRVFG